MSALRLRWSAAALATLAAPSAWGFVPYTPVPVGPPPTIGPFPSAPTDVWGKEYSHDRDFSVFGPTADPQQVIAWDGTGGTADGLDYSGTRPTWPDDQQVDAIANHRDALFDELLRGGAHLIFSHDDRIARRSPTAGGMVPESVAPGGPVTLTNGNVIGGAGEVSVSTSDAFGFPQTQTVWAKQPEVNRMPRPADVDGLEVWGPEPMGSDTTAVAAGDSNKYSLEIDADSGVSIWNLSGSPYLPHAAIVSAVESLLGPIPSSAFSLVFEKQGRDAVNLDALMVSDIARDRDRFDFEVSPPPTGEPILDQNGEPVPAVTPNGAFRGDSIIFSIRQIVDPTDPTGYYSTGSELFVLDALSGVSFLTHGGKVWDKAHAFAELSRVVPIGGDANGDGVVDLLDLDILGANFGKMPASFADGDFNSDGKVDLLDLDILGANFGNKGVARGGVIDINAIEAIGGNTFGGEVGLATAVPEPSATLVALVGIIAAGCCGRRG